MSAPKLRVDAEGVEVTDPLEFLYISSSCQIVRERRDRRNADTSMHDRKIGTRSPTCCRVGVAAAMLSALRRVRCPN